MPEIHWYKRRPREWTDKTRKLPLEDRAVFADIVEAIYTAGNQLEDDDEELALHIRCSKRKYATIKARLIERNFIYIQNGFIRSSFCDEEANKILLMLQEIAEKWANCDPRRYDSQFFQNRQIVLSMHDRCVYCGTENPPFEIDHIVPVSRGGTSELNNLTLACKSCNRDKGAKLVEEWRN